ILIDPAVVAVHEKVQLVVPVAGAQVTPPSTDTSIPATWPPPASVAVPLIVIVVPAAIDAPLAGEEITQVGAVLSVEIVAATNRVISVAGCTFISAKRLIIACCIERLVGALPRSCKLSSPHDH